MEIEDLNIEVDNLRKRVVTLEQENKQMQDKIQKMSKEMLTMDKWQQEIHRQRIQQGIR